MFTDQGNDDGKDDMNRSRNTLIVAFLYGSTSLILTTLITRAAITGWGELHVVLIVALYLFAVEMMVVAIFYARLSVKWETIERATTERTTT